MSVLCPKCQTSYTWVETDPNSGGTPMLRCRCGLCIYGIGAVELVVRKQQEEAESHRKRDLEKALIVEASASPEAEKGCINRPLLGDKIVDPQPPGVPC